MLILFDPMSVIKTSNLSKSYYLGHQGTREKYTALRDVIGKNLKNAIRTTGNIIKGNQLISGDEMEEFWALKDVSFEIAKGEVVGIIGKNGAGKSTLLKILSRITEPTRGRVEIRGRVSSLLEVGTGFHPELTGRENIFLNGAILGMSRREIQKKFDEIIAFAEVERFLDTPVKRYSSGMYVRLAFSVAAHLEPDILIVDEVLAVGDASFQKKCLGKMGHVSSTGRTVLFVSHNMGAVASLCSRALLLEGGELVASGNAREIIDQYQKTDYSNDHQTIDLSIIRRGGEFGEKLKIEKLEWFSALPLTHSEVVRGRITFTATQDIEEVTMGIGFSTIEGVRLLTYETDFQDGYRPSLKAGEKHSVDFEIHELNLAPGIYSLDVGSRSGDFAGLDYLPNCSQMEIAIGPKTPGYIARNNAGVRLKSKWIWEKQIQ